MCTCRRVYSADFVFAVRCWSFDLVGSVLLVILEGPPPFTPVLYFIGCLASALRLCCCSSGKDVDSFCPLLVVVVVVVAVVVAVVGGWCRDGGVLILM